MSLSPLGRYKRPPINRRAAPQYSDATLNDFSGGLDLSDNDLKLKTNFSKVLRNIHRDVDGTLSVRWGTKLFKDVTGTVAGTILDVYYFRDKIIVFMTSGEICTVTDNGTITAIWNTAIAAALPGTPTGWSSGLTLVDWTEFRNELVVNNGVDKPIIISKTHTVTYLQDVATGSNVFTPIAKFVTTVGNYTVMAGVPASPDEVYISSAGTSGTWPGDAIPNDSTSINIAAYVPSAGSDIRGVASYKNWLIVYFATSSVVIVLGEYETTTHKPRVLDTIAEQGLISHRMINVFAEEILSADDTGVYKSKRNVFSSGVENEKMSSRVQTDYIASAPSDNATRLASFSVYNKLENRVMYFLKNGSVYNIYTLSFDEGFKRRAWSTYSDLLWTAGCTSLKGRVFVTKGTKIFQLGNEVFSNEDYTGEYIDEFDTSWLTATGYVVGDRVLQTSKVYICLEAHTSDVFVDDLANNFWEEYRGAEIDYDWELPWTDTNSRMKKKRLGYVGIDTVGEAPFTVEVYVDNFRVDENNDDDPLLSMEFVAGSILGYGGANDQNYGGGRRASDERLWGTPCEFKILKLRVKGKTNRRLKIVAITLLYRQGTYQR